ncbi:MAG TPA: aminotransferase class III-fold pyridoxal phosphate-dependent enzyme [Thermodesulfobacteriota bacterium]|nr:aminotransferase class III-fold pyridoxal phosphate-dependent enzyme [Thermodesulfobacteriota bacterium]
MRDFARSKALYDRAKELIPGGFPAHQSPDLLVKGESPCFIERAKGCRFWDVDGNEYIDYMCAYGPMIIGYNNAAVEKAVAEQKKKGDCFNLPSPLWVELAERMVEMIPAADWVTFGKNGSDVCNHAIRVARAYTGRKKLAMLNGAYHGIGSWCSPMEAGITPEERMNVLTFPFNDLDALREIIESNRGDLAAIVVTPFKHEFLHDLEMPTKAFVRGLNEICRGDGPLLVLDDVRAGFRLHMGGSAEYFGLKPHITCFSKAMGNGYPISACVGLKEIKEAASQVFFTGSFFSNSEPIAASLATIEEMVRTDAISHIFRMGEMLKQGILDQARALGIEISYTGPVSIPFMIIQDKNGFEKNRLFCARAYQEGVFFHPYHNWFVSAAHGEKDIEETLKATQKAFEAVKQAS